MTTRPRPSTRKIAPSKGPEPDALDADRDADPTMETPRAQRRLLAARLRVVGTLEGSPQ